MIRREMDADLANQIASSPAVRPNVCYHDDEIDLWPAVRGCCVLSNGEDAVAIFEQTEPGRWQSHTMFAETCRGKRAVETGKEMVAWMFNQRGVDVLWGATPMKNKPARWFNRQLGAVVIGHDDYEAEGPVEIFEIRRD
jgi:hypothetical protein